MAIIDACHSVKEEEKPLLARRYHNTDECAIGRAIPEEDRRDATPPTRSARIAPRHEQQRVEMTAPAQEPAMLYS